MHGCACPVRSTKSPITANTCRSSVKLVQSASAGAGVIGQNVLYTGTILRPATPPCALMSLMYASYTLYSSTRVVWMYGSMHLKSTSATPTLIVVSVTPGPSVFTTGAAPEDPAGFVVVLVPDFVPLPHSASATVSAANAAIF